MQLLNGDLLARFSLPMPSRSSFEIDVELASRIVGNIQQRNGLVILAPGTWRCTPQERSSLSTRRIRILGAGELLVGRAHLLVSTDGLIGQLNPSSAMAWPLRNGRANCISRAEPGNQGMYL